MSKNCKDLDPKGIEDRLTKNGWINDTSMQN